MTDKAKILIVDDKVNNLVAMEKTLEEVEVEFVKATSGNDALIETLEHDLALAILDVQMPGMDGYELAQLMRSREQTRHVPIIFVSAVYSDEFHIFKGYDSGAVDFITKPFEPKILINKVGVFLELYDQKQKLRQSANLYEKTFDAITDVVMIQDESMRILQVNKTGCDILGLSEEDIIGKFCYEIFNRSKEPCPGCKLTFHDQRFQPCTWEIQHGKLGICFLLSASPLVYEQEKALLTVYVARDITEQKKIKEQLLQAEKLEAIGTLTGGIAHDFNNILSAILGYTQLSLLDHDITPTLKDNLLHISKAGERAKDLVAQILTFSRKSNVMRRPILISPIIKEALKLLHVTIPKTIEIREDIATSHCKIMADPIEIHQVIMNLCTNSFHAMEDESGVIEVSLVPITIEARKARRVRDLHPGEYLRLTVSDTGKGMEKKLQSRIFDPFFTTKEQGKGTGMGLSVVHGVIRHCGGAITVKSDPGKGAAFEIFFPVVEHEKEQETGEDDNLLVKGSGLILYVDDEPDLVKLGKNLLEYLGYSVVTASSGSDALVLFREKTDKFDAVVTDQTMPNMPGNILAEELMRIRPDIPIILCTGHSTLVSEKQALKAGIKAYLIKPISIKILGDTLHMVIDEAKNK